LLLVICNKQGMFLGLGCALAAGKEEQYSDKRKPAAM
jgi:hypothetical protein